MRVILIWGILAMLFFTFGCADKPSSILDEIPSAEINIVKEVEDNVDQENITEIELDSEEIYGLETLVADLKNILNVSYYNFTRDTTDQEFMRSSHLKYYVIHTINNSEKKVNTSENFCNEYCAGNWEGWKYFVNMSNLEAYFPPLKESDFDHPDKYDRYVRDRILVNSSVIERAYDVGNGKVLEYQFNFWGMEPAGVFDRVREDTLLIYKVPCSHNMTVFLRPRWQSMYITGWSAGGFDHAFQNWQHEIASERETFLNWSREIIDSCPVEDNFFEDFPDQNYFQSEIMTAYWRVYYEDLFDIKGNMSVGARKKSSFHSNMILEQINVTFTNHDDVALYNTGLKIVVSKDDKPPVTYYDSENAVSVLRPGKEIKRSVSKEKIEFENNITVTANFYRAKENIDVGVITNTYTRSDFGIFD